MANARLVLDTNIVRNLGAGRLDPACFGLLPAAGISIHLADGTATELAAAILGERMPWDHWVIARQILRGMLSGADPILIGGQQGLQRAGVSFTAPLTRQSIEDAVASMKAAWRILRSAKSLETLPKTAAFLPSGAAITLNTIQAKRTTEAFHADWIATTESFFRAMHADVPRLSSELPRRRDDKGLIDQLQKLAWSESDHNADYLPLSFRLDAFLRVRSLLLLRRMRREDVYNPAKNSNDSFDLEILKYLAHPTAICTSDGGIMAKVEDSGSWQRPWIVAPEELSDPSVVKRISALEWPAQNRND